MNKKQERQLQSYINSGHAWNNDQIRRKAKRQAYFKWVASSITAGFVSIGYSLTLAAMFVIIWFAIIGFYKQNIAILTFVMTITLVYTFIGLMNELATYRKIFDKYNKRADQLQRKYESL